MENSSVRNNEKRRIAIVGNATNTLIRFRFDLIEDLINQGHQVFAFAPGYSKIDKEKVRKIGAEPVNFKMDREGVNPLYQINQIIEIQRLFERHEIDTVFSYFIKPVIYASIAAKRAGITEVYSMLCGLGYLFTTEKRLAEKSKKILLRLIVIPLFKIALSYNQKIIFQNPDDLDVFLDMRLVCKEKSKRIYGSGVNIDVFEKSTPEIEKITFITTGRLIEEKGFREYAKAAEITKKLYPKTKFILLGGTDNNPNTLQEKEIKRWVDEGHIIWPGKVDNVKEWLSKSSVFVLASYYREGTPRSTLEALATGRAVITTDVPGCRETVVEGGNGFLVPPRDAEALAEKMIHMIENPDLVHEMGRESRRMAEELYDVKKVNASIIEAMGL